MRPLPLRRTLRPSLASGLVLLALLGTCRAAQADAVDDYVRKRMSRERIPGLSLAVVRDGKVIKARGYGYASLELKVPAREETVYELASTTKPLMAIAVMLLANGGKAFPQALDLGIAPLYPRPAPASSRRSSARGSGFLYRLLQRIRFTAPESGAGRLRSLHRRWRRGQQRVHPDVGDDVPGGGG